MTARVGLLPGLVPAFVFSSFFRLATRLLALGRLPFALDLLALDLLATDETNPRSIAFQAAALVDHVEALPRGASQLLLASEQRVALALLTDLRLADVYALAKVDASGERIQLDHFLERCAAHFRALSDEITTHYLIHAGPSRQIGEIRPG